MVELGEQVDRKVPDMMQYQCGGHLRPGTWLCKVERSDANLIADSEGVHSETRRRSKTWLAPCGNVAKKLMEPGFFRRHIMWASVQEHRPFPACKSCHALLGGHSAACRSRFERMWKDADLIKATAEAVKDARQVNSSASTMETFSATQPMSGTSSNPSGLAHQASASSAADTSAAADQAAAPVNTPSAPSETVSWTVCLC